MRGRGGEIEGRGAGMQTLPLRWRFFLLLLLEQIEILGILTDNLKCSVGGDGARIKALERI